MPLFTQIADLAKSTLAPRAEPTANVMSAIRARWKALEDCSPQELRAHGHAARLLAAHESVESADCRILAFALMAEALRRARGLRLYDVQFEAALALAAGSIAEMQTGEGKTFASAPAAFLHALAGRGVHIATPNEYLANRDFDLLRPAYMLLGARLGLNADNSSSESKRDAYRCEVTYGTGHEFGFDYLRDQLVLRAESRRRLGEGVLGTHPRGTGSQGSLLQRGLHYAIIDEIDNVLLDDATSPLVLSQSNGELAVDADVHLAALRLARRLQPELHFQRSNSTGRVQLTRQGHMRIHDDQFNYPIESLRRTWAEYVEQALLARTLERDVHYSIDSGGRVQVVDQSTGRIFEDRTLSEGLHQAVEAKEGLAITQESQILAQITRQRFARLYARLAGMTGTATGCERELRNVYQLKIQTIPLRTESRRRLLPARFFASQDEKRRGIAKSVQQLHAERRPVLIGTCSIAESERLASVIEQHGLAIQVLNGRQDAQEADIIAAAGRLDAVTIATNLAGRGTDIKLQEGAEQMGGLHVIVSECNESHRMDRQLVGRCGRQGDAGSAQVFVSAEDAIITRYGPWLAKSIKRNADEFGEAEIDLMPQIRRLQRAAERRTYAVRNSLFKSDLARDAEYAANHGSG